MRDLALLCWAQRICVVSSTWSSLLIGLLLFAGSGSVSAVSQSTKSISPEADVCGRPASPGEQKGISEAIDAAEKYSEQLGKLPPNKEREDASQCMGECAMARQRFRAVLFELVFALKNHGRLKKTDNEQSPVCERAAIDKIRFEKLLSDNELLRKTNEQEQFAETQQTVLSAAVAYAQKYKKPDGTVDCTVINDIVHSGANKTATNAEGVVPSKTQLQYCDNPEPGPGSAEGQPRASPKTPGPSQSDDSAGALSPIMKGLTFSNTSGPLVPTANQLLATIPDHVLGLLTSSQGVTFKTQDQNAQTTSTVQGEARWMPEENLVFRFPKDGIDWRPFAFVDANINAMHPTPAKITKPDWWALGLGVTRTSTQNLPWSSSLAPAFHSQTLRVAELRDRTSPQNVSYRYENITEAYFFPAAGSVFQDQFGDPLTYFALSGGLQHQNKMGAPTATQPPPNYAFGRIDGYTYVFPYFQEYWPGFADTFVKVFGATQPKAFTIQADVQSVNNQGGRLKEFSLNWKLMPQVTLSFQRSLGSVDALSLSSIRNPVASNSTTIQLKLGGDTTSGSSGSSK